MNNYTITFDVKRTYAYADALVEKLPISLYENLICLFLIFSIITIFWKGSLKGFKWSALLLAVEYFFLVLSSAVLYREQADCSKYEFTPFWTYHEIAAGKDVLLMEAVLNIILFIPIGFLLSVAMGRKGWWKVLVIGFIGSCVVEILQFSMKRGLCETDDVFHNTLGCGIGIFLYLSIVILSDIFIWIYKRFLLIS